MLIVESPHKAKTISQWFGNDWIVIATAGHIKNLPVNDYGIDENNKAKWVVQSNKKDILIKLKSAILKSKNIYIGTDDDREGERIAFDIVEYFKIKNYYRVIFHEITKKAIASALKNSIFVDKKKVESQKARRIIDRITGYPITSGTRWYLKKNKILTPEEASKMGIGRVSAAALGIVVRNEHKIENFTPSKYKKIYIDYIYNSLCFTVTNNVKFKEENEESLNEIYAVVANKRNPNVVESYNNKTKEVSPYPPLTTSRILRNLNYLYGYAPKDTMSVLQELYDGVLIDGSLVGLITYPRTDSLNISDEAVNDIIKFLFYVAEINKTKIDPEESVAKREKKFLFDESYILDFKREYTNKNQNIFEAHEAIRPTNVNFEFSPKALKPYLNEMQFKIYEFIFYRTVSTQMKNSIYDISNITIDIEGNKFIAFANKKLFSGWEILLGNKIKKSEDQEDELERTLPDGLYVGDIIVSNEVRVESHDEKTPPRYGVGRFITTLETNSIGRPSTIADIIPTLTFRGYVSIVKNMIIPTEVGKRVYGFIEKYAEWLIDIDHTKKFEEALDKIEQTGESLPLIEEYTELKNEFLDKIGYDTSNKPDQWLIDKAISISKEKNETLPEDMLQDKNRLYKYYNDYKKETKVGKCLKCKKGDVCEYNTVFKCSSYECDFFISKESIVGFFSNFNKDFPIESSSIFIKQLLAVKKVYVKNLYSKNKDNYFDAFVTIEQNGKYFNFKLSFPKTKMKTIDEKYIFDELATKKSETSTRRPKEDTGFINLVESKDTFSKTQEFVQLEKENRLLKDRANKDVLTRAYNRQKLDNDIQELQSSDKFQNASVTFIDADKFKNVNDMYGHAAGDLVLKTIIDICFQESREQDNIFNIYRYGGEEFILLSYTDETSVFNAIERIRENVSRKKIKAGENTISVTVSAGIAFAKNHKDINETIAAADTLMYNAKKYGRNRTEIETEGVVEVSTQKEKSDEVAIEEIEW